MKKTSSKKQEFDFITIGSASLDIMYYANGGEIVPIVKPNETFDSLAFRLGSKNEIDQAHFNYGGGADNVAVALAMLGFKVATIMAIGDDHFSKELINYLNKRKINTSLIQQVKKKTLGMSFIINNKTDRRYVLFTCREANADLKFSAKNYKNLKTKWIYLNSLNFTGWEKSLDEVVKYKKENPTTKIYWNPGSYQIKAGQEKIKQILSLTEVLQINRDEANCLWQNNPNLKCDILDINSVIKAVHSLGPKIVVITDAQNGAYCYDGQKVYYQGATSHKSVDTTGAGDSFGSGFIGGLLLKSDIDIALKFGAINSGNVVSSIGAHNDLQSKSQILKQLKNI